MNEEIREVTLKGRIYPVRGETILGSIFDEMFKGNPKEKRIHLYKCYVFGRINKILRLGRSIWIIDGANKNIKCVNKNKYIKKYIREYPE